ncbi:hypothetical protein [Demequina activiva]|uniref:DUF2975 domain-containing protein n=1 Tax=Demequina activiva TaxID=1582364 RepID=A0A919Q2D4_9MICO|nr:hypothetical protein [Demequina activiva]GIG55005.1 hypothetical protein Dac01nite_17570 [Demequina activiva]
MNESMQLSKSDRIGMVMSIVIVAFGAGITVLAAVRRLLEVGDGRDVPVTVPLAGESASLPLGPDGAGVTATVEMATVTVPDPAPATAFALYAEPVWMAVITLLGIGVAALFFLRLARGHAFTAGSSRLAYMAAGIVAVGWLGSSILTNMTTNGALSAISDYTYEAVTFEVSLAPALVVLVVAAVGAALQIGERLQRETEGLV